MHAGEVNLRHVTGHTLLRTYRTSISVTARGLRVSWFRQMAGETFRIVVRRVFLQLLVRIMTGNATKPRVIRVVSATTEHAIRLKANVVDAALSLLQHRLLETGVTRTAKRL